jgi:SAM-dependent methyltransferase
LTFDAAVRDYERGRTGWPEAVMDGVLGNHVLDLAAGTGKLTRSLVRRFPKVTAVEPLVSMRELGARLVPAATWLDGTAEALPLSDSDVDGAFVAEAFHWFDSRRAVAELARVVRSGGLVTVLFTVWDGSFEPGLSPEALEAVEEVSRRTGSTGGPKWMAGRWQEGFTSETFGPLEERDIPFEHVTDHEGVISYYLSVSTIAARPQDEREALAERLRVMTPPGEHRLSVRARMFRTVRQ